MTTSLLDRILEIERGTNHSVTRYVVNAIRPDHQALWDYSTKTLTLEKYGVKYVDCSYG
jgi:hypothetical protein